MPVCLCCALALVFPFAPPVFLAFKRHRSYQVWKELSSAAFAPCACSPGSSSHYKLLWKRHLFSHCSGAMDFFCPHGFADHHDCLSFYLPSVFFETGLELAKGDLELLLCDETFWGDTVYSPPVRAPTTDENTHDGQM